MAWRYKADPFCHSEQVESIKSTLEQRSQVLSPALGLTVHPSLAPLAKLCLDHLELASSTPPTQLNKGRPVLASTLKDLSQTGGLAIGFTEFRARFLEWLEGRGAGGVGELLGTSLQSLVRRREGREVLPTSQAE